MDICNAAKHALGVAAAAATLAACSGGTQSQPPGPAPLNRVPGAFGAWGAINRGSAVHLSRERSWMSPDAKKHDLLYASDNSADVLYVYSFPEGTAEGKLTGFDEPAGLCSDAKGNIWITNQATNQLVEYAHGGASPIRTLNNDPGILPVGCSVDPTTGNLAVTNFGNGGVGSVAIWAKAKGTPHLYTDSQLYFGAYCGYDNIGNLFVDGGTGPSTGFVFAELPKGSSTLTNITLSGGTIYAPGQVQWDGKYVAVGDQDYQDQHGAGIYQTTGAGGQIVGTTALLGFRGLVPQVWIAGKTVVAPSYSVDFLLFYKYPAGGQPTKMIKIGDSLFGATVSRAK